MSEVLLSEGSAKLYEYNQYKPELEDEVIKHFGILGMRWGQRNGPPYPLGSDKSTGRRLKTSAGGGSGSGSVSRKRKKALKKARKTRAKNLKIKTLEKQKQQQLEKTKEEIIQSKDIKAMLRNVDKFTNQDINDMLNRLDVERRLKEQVARQEEASKSAGQRFKEGFKQSVKEGLVSGGKAVTKTVAKNAVKMGTKNLAKKLVGEAKTEGGDPYTELIDKLFKEEKK